jgi:RNA polymerase sigma-70 factor, ECF subfamily
MLGVAFAELAVRADALGLDRDGFRAFYDDALPRVYGYFLHRVGGAAPLAEDLTQETFLAAGRELKKGRRVDAPLGWILGIARHKLVDHLRRQERSVRLVDGGLDEATADVPVEDGSLFRDRAVAALSGVAASQRAALVLRHLDGLSVPEVARELDRSVEAVESLLARGRVSFRKAYAEEVAR